MNKMFLTLILSCFVFIKIFAQKEGNNVYHSTHKATFYSAVFPGLGQIYNKKAWKVPILYAGVGAMAYAIHFNSKYHKKYKNAYRDFIIRDPANKSYLEFIPSQISEEQIYNERAAWFEEALKSKKQYYRRYKELSYIGMGALYVLQMVDAAVDAHFFNFDISDDLSLMVTPTIANRNKTPCIQMQFTF